MTDTAGNPKWVIDDTISSLLGALCIYTGNG